MYFQGKMKSSGCGGSQPALGLTLRLFWLPFDGAVWTELQDCATERMEGPVGVTQHQCRVE